jgi:hypothetical protein
MLQTEIENGSLLPWLANEKCTIAASANVPIYGHYQNY